MAYNKVEAMWIPKIKLETGTKYLAIVDAITVSIRSGELLAGDRLPTQRDLAWELKVNISTITQAYKEATRRHLIGGEVGRGTFVLATSREAELFALKKLEPNSVIDLSTNIPARHPEDVGSQELLQEALRKGAGKDAFSYHSPELLARAQAAGSKWLSWRGHEVKPNSIVPCAGGQQALLATLLSTCEPGASVLVEEFTFPGMKAVARQLRLKLLGLACDREGVLPDNLEKVLKSGAAKLVVLTPNLQNPTGSVMGHKRRQEIAAIVKRNDALIVEDDIYGGLSGMPPFSREIPDHSILISSLSKTVAPGLRFGFVSGTERWIEPIRAEVHATNWAMSPFMVELACQWIEGGRAFARAEWQRHEVVSRWNLAKSRLKKMGVVCWEGTPCPHLWLAISKPLDEVVIVLRTAGLEVVPGTLFSTGISRGNQQTDRIRICLTAPETRAGLSQAIDKLVECDVLV